MKGQILLAFLLILFVAFSCKKKDDDIPPIININSPDNNQQYEYGDKIEIKANISDNINLSTITASLYDESYNLIGKPKIFHPGATTYNLNTDLLIDMNDIVTGTYFVQVSANDGYQTTKDFVEIMIDGQQLEQSGVFVFSNSGIVSNVYMLDANLDLQLEFTHNYNILDAIVNSQTQQLSILSTSGNMSTYKIADYSLSWTKDNINDFQSNFRSSLKVYDSWTFASYRNGNIYAFDANGTIRQSASIGETNYYPTIFAKHYDHLIVALENEFSLPNKIEKTFYSTGVPINNYDIDFTAEEIFSYDGDKAIIWGNKNSVAKVCTLSVLNNVVYELSNMPSGTLYTVSQIDESNYIICIDNNLKIFNTYNDVFSDYKLGVHADIIKYNDFDGYLYVVDNNKLLIYNYTTGALIKEITHTNTINDIDFWFNK